jgi:hypothetical protein
MAAALLGAIPCAASAQASCDRNCLNRAADAWFAAMVAHDPGRAPIASNARFTEQTQVQPIGEGLWKTASEAPTTFKIYVADPVAGQIGGIVMMKDAGKAHLQDPQPEDPRDRGDRLHAAVELVERLERVPALTHVIVDRRPFVSARSMVRW